MQIFIQSHWTSSGNCRDELVVLIGVVDWSSVNWQGKLSSSEHQADSAIYEHTKRSGHLIDSEDIVILGREEGWFERGVREAIWERVEKPSLNKHGGLCFQLSHAWDQSLINIPCQLTLDQSTTPINTTSSSLQLPEEVQ